MTQSTNHKTQDEWVIEWARHPNSPKVTWDRYTWFFNPTKSTSMRLSKTGFKCLSEKVTGFSLYEITLNKPITPKQLIQLERLLTEPYSITSLTTIWVHSETDAIMLRLNSGNLGMYLDSLQDS